MLLLSQVFGKQKVEPVVKDETQEGAKPAAVVSLKGPVVFGETNVINDLRRCSTVANTWDFFLVSSETSIVL